MARPRKYHGPTITWLGGPGEPDENEWNGYVFKKGEPVEIAPDHASYMLRKAEGNPFYEVKGADADPVTGE